MRRKISFFCCSLILLLGVCTASAVEQVNQPADSNIPEKLIKKVPARAVEVNAPTGAMQQEQIEQTRQRARERIRQRSTQRRARALSPADANDTNIPGRLRSPGNVRPPEKAIDKAAQFQQQLIAIEQQLAYEKDKHLDRTARLNRIRELAGQQKNNEAIARVDKLIEKENQLYQIKTQRMEMRKDRVRQFLEKGPDSPNLPASPGVERGGRPAGRGRPAEIEEKPEGLKPAKDSNRPPDQNK